jgi:hypothetical protein
MQKTSSVSIPRFFKALLAGLTQITRIASAAHRVRAAVAWAAALRVDDNIMSAATDCFADQAVIVAATIAGRCVEKIDAEIDRAVDGGD